MNKILLFSLDNILFGVNINQVKSLSKLGKTAEFPESPKWIGGFVKYRDRVFPLVKLWELLHLETPEKKVLLLPAAFDYCAFLISGVMGIYELETDKKSSELYSLPYLSGFGTFEKKIVLEIELGNLLTENKKNTVKKLSKKNERKEKKGKKERKREKGKK
jgi:chemotaxis signal transduction protein